MQEMTGAEAMYEFLVQQGVRYVFGNPGTTELPLMDQFSARSEIEYILALHEDSALGIAIGYAEATGKPAVVNLHTNPGLAHALGNLYNAYRAGTPLIVTAGQQDTRSMIDEPLLFADMVELARQHTKWAWEVKNAAEVPAALARAFKIAQTPPTGPIFLSLPVDVMEARARMEIPPVVEIGRRTRGDRDKLAEAARVLLQSRNPCIVSGDGVARAGAVSSVVRLAEVIAARAHSEPLNSLLTFPTDHPLYAGPLFPNAKQTAALLEGVDVVLTIGVNNIAPLVYTGTRLIPPETTLLQIDTDVRELGKNYPCKVAIQGDPLSVVDELIELLQSAISTTEGASQQVDARRTTLESHIGEMRKRFLAAAEQRSGDGRMTAAFVALEMRRAAPRSTVLVDESVTSTAFVRTLFTLNEPGTFFYSKAGSLGLALPEAVGVKLAMPDRPVVCAVGDGTAMYTIQGLWSAARYKLPVVFVVFNNSSYMILKGGLLAAGGASAKKGLFPGMDITDPEVDFVRLAESMGVAARRASTPSDLKAALEWALSQSTPTLIDVPIGREPRSVLR
ncbi:MAG TPA: thiamine pyrophosphate-binding protein [Blastocatellia bacterium]|nr:thiamine pyrophosphate-binding protein [Blastocatellia bacterium]